MNEMIEIRQKPGESVWEIYHRFKHLKGNLKYSITDMQHIQFCELTVTTLEVSFETTKVPNSSRGSVSGPATGRKPLSVEKSSNRGVDGGSEESEISTEPE
jgi:hypothetical protein